MKDIFDTIHNWVKADKKFAIATVTKTWGSAPRPVGSAMLVDEQGVMAGSVSGGCVEGAVVKAALPLIASGQARQLAYGVADEEAWAVGLSCGGSIQVFVERFLAVDDRPAEKTVWHELEEALSGNRGCMLITRLAEGESQHWLVKPDGNVFGKPLSDYLLQQAMQAYQERKTQIVEEDEVPYFVQVFPRKSQVLIIGAAHITVDLVDLACQFGFETTVIDPRGAFAHKTSFTQPPDYIFEQYPSEVLGNYPLDAYTYAAVLSHDPKIDDNALHILLRSRVAYIGALGSRKTHAKRVARLQAAGFTDEQISRIHAPIGVDIHAKSAKEIALSIMGQIVKVKNKFL